MSIWERIRDSLSALARGEPFARVFERLTTPPERSVAFAIAVIALGAKMAKADGQVTRDEVAAFREIIHIPKGEEKNAARIFNLARTDVAGFEIYAERVARMFQDRPEVLADLLEGLVYIASADGHYHEGEAAFLDEVARIFGISEARFRAIRARHAPGEIDPYAVLGLPLSVTPEEIRARYRELVRDLHPDRMIGRGVPPEAQRLAEHRLAAVNEAYARLRRETAG